MAEGFLGRWSQRKQAVRAGQPLTEPALKENELLAPAEPVQAATTSISNLHPVAQPVCAPGVSASDSSQPVAAPAPTLDDVQALSPDDSFARFVTPDVSPAVRNAAMKKLFADPHYNVMDGLDIYIDDYSIPSPLPASMLQKMASAQFLKLVEEPEPPEAPAAGNKIQSAPLLNPEPDHDHPDLRLQPDDAAGRAVLEREPERAADIAQQPVPPPSC